MDQTNYHRDYEIGDEVVCIDISEYHPPAHHLYGGPRADGLQIDQIYRVIDIVHDDYGIERAFLADIQNPNLFGYDSGFGSWRFRKVLRRNLEEWLGTENTIEEPKRIPELV